jgi:hypothetical protein
MVSQYNDEEIPENKNTATPEMSDIWNIPRVLENIQRILMQ